MRKINFLRSYKLQASSLKVTNLQPIKLAACGLQLAAILILTAASCNKEEPKHRDVFRCEINGEPWEAGCDSQNLVWACDYMDCQYYEDTGYLSIRGRNKVSDNGISIVNHNNLLVGKNTISNGTYGVLGEQYTVEDHGEIIIIKIDLLNKIIEGEFNFIAHSISGDSVKICNGYFKTKYRP